MKKLTILIIASIIVLSGCASNSELETLSKYNAEMVKSQVAKKDIPTLTIKCGESSDACKGLDVTFIHPADRQKIVSHRIRGTNDVIVETMPSFTRMFTWAAGAFAATRIVDDVMANTGSGNITTHNTNTINGDDNVTTATSDISRSTSTVGDTTTTELTDNSSVNNSTHDNSDNSDNSIIDSHDATATPTIVEPSVHVFDPVIVSPSYPPSN